MLTEKSLRSWKIKILRNMWHTAKLLQCESGIQAAIDAELEKLEAKPERDRMKNIHTVMMNSGQSYDKV